MVNKTRNCETLHRSKRKHCVLEIPTGHTEDGDSNTGVKGTQNGKRFLRKGRSATEAGDRHRNTGADQKYPSPAPGAAAGN